MYAVAEMGMRGASMESENGNRREKKRELITILVPNGGL